MEAKQGNFPPEKFEHIREERANLSKKIGFVISNIPFIPVSAYWGDNLIEKSNRSAWYGGPTLLEAIDSLQLAPTPEGKSLRFPIFDAFKIGGIGTVITGKVFSGVIKPGMELSL